LQLRCVSAGLCHGGAPLTDGSTHPTREQPADSEEWTAFHKAVEKLPEDECETFNLLFYEGLTQEEAAALLEVTVPTIKRRWQRARVLLHESLSAGK